MAKKGKYAEVVKTLPRFVSEDRTYQDRINARKEEILKGNAEKELEPEPNTATHLAQTVAECRELKDAIKEELSRIQLDLDARTQLLIDAYEREGVTSMSLVDGGSVRIQAEPYPQIFDQDKLREWAIENGYERKLQLHFKTVEALTKQALLDGQDAPPGVKPWVNFKAVYTR